MLKRILIINLSIFSGISLLAAQERRLSLEEALSYSLNHNPEIRLAQREIEASRGRKFQLQAIPNPELLFGDEGLPGGKFGQEHEIRLGLEQIIEFPGKRALRGMIGQYGEDMASLELGKVKRIVASRVETAYLEAAHSQKLVSSLESLLVTLKEYIDIANERYKTGQVSYLDVIRGRMGFLKGQNDLIEAKRELKKDLINLNLAMGSSEPVRVVLTTEFDFIPLGKTLADLQAEVDSRPSLRVLSARQRQTEAGVRLSQKSLLPDLKLGLFYPSLRRGAWGFEVGFTLPLWLKGQRGGRLEAESLNEQSFISIESKKKLIRSQVEKAYEEIMTIEDQIRLFQDSLLAEVADALKIGITNYQYGKADSLSILDIYRTYEETQLEYLRALFNHRIALAELPVAGEEDQ